MTDDETIMAEKTSSPTGMTSRRQAIAVMGTTVSASIVGATMPALGAPAQTLAATPLREPIPPPALVPRGDLVDVLQYEPQARLVLGPAKAATI